MRTHQPVGSVTETATAYEGVVIQRTVVGHAYARNGHADSMGHGAPRYRWAVVAHGEVMARASSKSAAASVLPDLANEMGWTPR